MKTSLLETYCLLLKMLIWNPVGNELIIIGGFFAKFSFFCQSDIQDGCHHQHIVLYTSMTLWEYE